MLTVIVYDITDDRRRQRVSTFLEDHGLRVNYSVFECELDTRAFAAVHTELTRLINRHKDRVVFYQLCEGCRPRRATLGRVPENLGGASGVVFV